MSLINQALRKAQHQRTPNRPATAADQTNTPHPHYPTNTNKSGLLIGLVAGIALLIGLVAGLTIVVLRKDPAPAVQQANTVATPAPAPANAAIAAEPTTQPLVAAAPPSSPTQQLDQDSSNVLNELRLARKAAEAKAAVDAVTAQQAEAEALAAKQAAAAKPSQEIIQWLAHAKISGVRISEKGNKVILNNKAYSVGDSVNLRLGLKVLIIQEKRLLFIGSNGKKYMKQL